MAKKKAAEGPVEKTVPTIELGGRTWLLKINHRVLERFSAMSRCPLSEFDAVIERYDMMVLLLWLMMCETRQDLTRGGLNDWLNAFPVIDAVNLVNDVVAKAIEYAFPKPKESPDGDANEADPDNPTDADI